ncbi:MAG TPA: hypothetical protein VJA94_02755 [Candidatus Angelobacter sp.]
MKRLFPYFALLTLLSICSIPVMGQSAGYDLFQTGSGTSVDLSSLGLGVVNLQGVAIQGSSGNTDTIIHRTQNVPSGGGTVSVNVYALFMKSTSSVTFQGQSADVYVTINNTGGGVSTSTLPQPDSLSASTGSVTVRTDGTFDSNITVNADLIFVKAGTSVGNSGNWIGHQAASSTTLSSTNSSWSSSPPSGYPAPGSLPSGGFYPINIGGGHSTPSHVHAVVPARCSSGGLNSPTTANASGTNAKGKKSSAAALAVACVTAQ